jgi:Holliday junction resolvase RusA-like endonuclease/uncharacterized C2H2 Zn-finger protein
MSPVGQPTRRSERASVTPNTVAEINAAENTLFPETRSDIEIGLEKLRAIIADKDPFDMVCFVHDGDPCSKARARWHLKQQRFYTPQHVLTAQQSFAKRFERAVQERPWTCNVAIAAIFFRQSAQRIDVDNLMKLVMDAGTQAGVWKDDSQVTAQAAFIELDRQRPRTIVALCPTTSTLNRDPVRIHTCHGCGQLFKRNRFKDGIKHSVKFCSQSCVDTAACTESRCPRCGTIFRRTSSKHRYCSEACAKSPIGVRPPKDKERPWPLCAECGNPVSRRDYVRCSNCAPKGRPIGSKNQKGKA